MIPEQLAAIEARIEVIDVYRAGTGTQSFVRLPTSDYYALLAWVRELEAKLARLNFANISNVLEGGGGGSESSSAQAPGKDQ